MIKNAVVYEQPLNELIRVCLRLEQLFGQIDHYINDDSFQGTHHVVTAIINLLSVLDRPDLKAKLAKELNYHLVNLSRLENTPEIDQEKLRQLLRQLDSLMRCFIDSNGKLAQNLREVELLNNLRLHLSTPGGGCSFDNPLYHYCLQQPAIKRQQTIKSWLDEFKNIRIASELILQLVREGTKVYQRTADKGFYQELLDPQVNQRLIRVGITNSLSVYPEISVGRHFLSIRFFSPILEERPSQYLNNFSFHLAFGN